jgi:ACS family tartrate transporter-like MFS transporter
MEAVPATESRDTVGACAVAKISRRILPFVFVLYIIAYLDRANVAFAKLTMSRALGFSQAVFGLGAGLFFLGYFLLEIPGTLIVERWSARWWISRILITWGVCAAIMGFVRTAREFYVVRFLLGVAKAGFFPGLIVYLTHWFPSAYRARAVAGFVLAVPLSLVIGAPLSGLLLGANWLGLAGWRWMFILEGLPALIFGVVTLYRLTDRPREAGWLEPEERAWIEAEIEAERKQKAAGCAFTVWQAIRNRNVVLLALALFSANIGVVGYLLWLPSTIQKASGFSAGISSAVSALPFAAGTISVVLLARSSDRTGERGLHTALPLVLSALLFAATAIPGQPFATQLLWLSLTGGTIFAWAPTFWVLPTLALGESAAAAAVGFINSVGNLGGFVGPTLVGYILTRYRSFSPAVVVLSGCLLAGATLTFVVSQSTRVRLSAGSVKSFMKES